MKYLKHIFESKVSQTDIEEICYDLTDNGEFLLEWVTCVFGTFRFYIHTSSRRKKQTRSNYFNLKEVIDVVERLTDYLGEAYECTTINYLSFKNNIKVGNQITINEPQNIRSLINDHKTNYMRQVYFLEISYKDEFTKKNKDPWEYIGDITIL